MKNYVKYGSNMILTPIFTPALDTEVGAERPTVQLIDVTPCENGYSFGFEKLDRFMDLAEKNGIFHFEIAHLFTQWGAKFTPKIVTTDGEKIFGWHVSAIDPRYIAFINDLLSKLKAHLKENSRFERCYFHISDEPSDEHLTSYTAAKNVVRDVLSDCKCMDALSEYKYYQSGLVQIPIPSNDAIDEFIKNDVSPLWTYYCCAQASNNVSNSFIAMPSARSRILGLQLYRYNISGFLHWGYNFWYSQFSKRPIDPYFTTDADETFESGDPFLVYPGEDGTANPSLRELVFAEAITDLCALRLLESLMGRDETISWIESLAGQKITFSQYPHGSEFILNTRNQVNKKIKSYIK